MLPQQVANAGTNPVRLRLLQGQGLPEVLEQLQVLEHDPEMVPVQATVPVQVTVPDQDQVAIQVQVQALAQAQDLGQVLPVLEPLQGLNPTKAPEKGLCLH